MSELKFYCAVSPGRDIAHFNIDPADGCLSVEIYDVEQDTSLGEVCLTREEAVKLRNWITKSLRTSR